MSRRTRKKQALALNAANGRNGAGAVVAPIQPEQMGGLSGYDAGNWSTRRGYVYFPTLDTSRELAPYVRTEIIRKTRWLTKNVGFAKRCTHGLAQMVGAMTPRATTSDKEWNRLAEAAFERRCGTGEGTTFERSGRFNAYAIQPMLTSCRLTDGDIGLALTESLSGGAMVQAYESHQIGNAHGPGKPQNWYDGVLIFSESRVAYRLLDAENPRKFVDIPARDFILHGKYANFGQTRPEPPLAHAVTNLLDITEIRGDTKLGIKLGNRIGYYIAKQLPTAGASAPRGMGGGRVQVGVNEAGEPILVENVHKGGKIMDSLKPGEEIRQLLDQRPHPNSRDFIDDLGRDIADGIGMPPDVLINVAKLGGASIRYVLAAADGWIKAQQQLLVDQVLHRFWVYFIAKEIVLGRLRACEDPDWHWKVGFLPPQRLTVDIGRDGKLSIDLHRAGMLTLQRWFGEQGLDHEEEIYQHVREYALKRKACEEVGAEFGMVLDPDKVFPPAPGQAALETNGRAAIEPFAADANVQQILAEIHEGVLQLRAAA